MEQDVQETPWTFLYQFIVKRVVLTGMVVVQQIVVSVLLLGRVQPHHHAGITTT